MTLLSGCVNGASPVAVCDGSLALRADHAQALATDGGPLSQRTGVALISALDAGCGDAG
jgi:hypothetical protein